MSRSTRLPVYASHRRGTAWLRLALSLATMAGAVLYAWVYLAQAQTTDKTSVLQAINQVRLSSGLTPLAVNPALEKAAQQHSDDMAAQSYVDHTGSNGSNPLDRILAAGYPAWPKTNVWAENVYAGSHGFNEALDYFMKDDAQRRNLLSSRYREIGIGAGVAINASGGQMVYWTLDFGSQPNVLPIFINDGVTLINTPQVAIHLTQEDAVPGGEGAAIGRIIDLRISGDSTFKDADWRPWEPLIPFTFDSRPGLKSVYVQMRDGGGRVTVSTASVQYDPNSTPQVISLGPGYQFTPEAALETPTEITPTPVQTVIPIQTAAPVSTAGNEPAATVAATTSELVVAPPVTEEAHHTPGPPTIEATASQTGHADPSVPDTILGLYLIGQTLLIVAGVYGFFHARNTPVAKPSDR